MNLRKPLCGLILPAVLAAFASGPAFAAAPGKTKTYNYTGTVANFCSVNSPVGLSFTMQSSSNGMTIAMSTPTNLSYSISCNVSTTLKMDATALHTTASVTGQESAIGNYTATLTPWGVNTVTVTTTAPSSDNGTTKYSGSASSGGAVSSASGSVAITGPTWAAGKSKFKGSATYSASITLTLTPGS